METFLSVLYIFVVISASVIVFYFIAQAFLYYTSIYYRQTKLPFYKVWINMKSQTVYMLARKLCTLKLEDAKFLFNVYLPSGSEIYSASMVMICKSGIYLFAFQNAPSSYKHLRRITGDNYPLNLFVLTRDQHNKKFNTSQADIYYINYRSVVTTVNNIFKKHESSSIDKVKIDSIYKSILPFRQSDYAKRYYHTIQIEDRIQQLDALLEQENNTAI